MYLQCAYIVLYCNTSTVVHLCSRTIYYCSHYLPLSHSVIRIATIQDLSSEEAIVVLVGNKCDLTESRVVTPDQCRELAQSLGVQFFETSVKDDINIKNVFDYLVGAVYEKMAQSLQTST